jgi:hypothetical protein
VNSNTATTICIDGFYSLSVNLSNVIGVLIKLTFLANARLKTSMRLGTGFPESRRAQLDNHSYRKAQIFHTISRFSLMPSAVHSFQI